jgi:FdhE protein
MKTKADKPSKTVDPIVRRLRALVKDSPDLRDAAQVYEIILPILRDADPCSGPVSITQEEARTKMKRGLPLLHGLDLEIDGQAAGELMTELAWAVERAGKKKRRHGLRLPWVHGSEKPGTAARRMRLALEGNRLDVGALLQHAAANEKGPAATAAQRLGLDPDLAWTLAQNALRPALRAWCRQLIPLAREIPWHKGYCFVCGASPMLGEFQENDQVKHLRCGQCGADWLFRRLQCSYCGNEDHRTLGYLCAESTGERMRAEVCEKCHGYLKVIASFTPTAPEMLAAEDLATLHLDYIARERGYARVFTQ